MKIKSEALQNTVKGACSPFQKLWIVEKHFGLKKKHSTSKFDITVTEPTKKQAYKDANNEEEEEEG